MRMHEPRNAPARVQDTTAHSSVLSTSVHSASPHLCPMVCRPQASWRQLPGLVAVALALSCVTLLLCSALMKGRQHCSRAQVAQLPQLNSTLDFAKQEPCPPWIEEYARFHAWSLDQPSPRFLVYVCGLNSSDDRHETFRRCSGTGALWASVAFVNASPFLLYCQQGALSSTSAPCPWSGIQSGRGVVSPQQASQAH